jgi:hypothetical protein
MMAGASRRPRGGVADSLDEAKAAFRAAGDGSGKEMLVEVLLLMTLIGYCRPIYFASRDLSYFDHLIRALSNVIGDLRSNVFAPSGGGKGAERAGRVGFTWLRCLNSIA